MMICATGIAGAALAVACVLVSGAPLQADGGTNQLPVRHTISNVRFIGWRDVAPANYDPRDVTNPGVDASYQMEREYWNGNAHGATNDGSSAEWEIIRNQNPDLDDIKRFVVQGIPVRVRAATTPYAHRLYYVVSMCGLAEFGELIQQAYPTSGALGSMAALDVIDRMRRSQCPNGIDDSVIALPRVVIGYDDERSVMIMHDPSLGPGFEVPYDDLRAMIATLEKGIVVGRPPDWKARIEAGSVGSIPRVRTADDDAAVALFHGNALAAVGRQAEAEQVYRDGLALQGVSVGREHLIRLELGVLLMATDRLGEAVTELRHAVKLFPGHFRAWANLGRALEEKSKYRVATREFRKAQRLCSPEGQAEAAAGLATDFFIVGCDLECLGWGFRPCR